MATLVLKAYLLGQTNATNVLAVLVIQLPFTPRSDTVLHLASPCRTDTLVYPLDQPYFDVASDQFYDEQNEESARLMWQDSADSVDIAGAEAEFETLINTYKTFGFTLSEIHA